MAYSVSDLFVCQRQALQTAFTISTIKIRAWVRHRRRTSHNLFNRVFQCFGRWRLVFLHQLDNISNLGNHRCVSGRQLHHLLLHRLRLCSLRTDICIVAVHLTVKTHNRLVLTYIFIILAQQPWEILLLNLFFLAVSWLVPHVAAVMASDPCLIWLCRVAW